MSQLVQPPTCVDCFLKLTPDRERAVYQELQRLDAEQNMEVLSFLERQGMEKGIDKGIEQGTVKTQRDHIIRLGRRSCGAPSESTLEAIRRIEDVARLDRMFDATATAQSWDQLLATE